jgi:amino acid transporter
LAYLVGPVCLLALRFQNPDLKRPFRLPFFKFASFLAFYVCNLMVYWSGWEVISKVIIAIAVGTVLFLLTHYVQEKSLKRSNVFNGLWLIPYFGMLGTISYLGNFGGGTGMIPFGWDFGFIALSTLISLIFAMKCALSSKESMSNMDAIIK